MDLEGHLARGMGGAGEAGVKTADARLHSVQQGLGEVAIAEVMASNLGDGAVHGTVVLTRGDDQVHLVDQTIAIHPVVMEQGAPGGFADPHGFMGLQA